MKHLGTVAHEVTEGPALAAISQSAKLLARSPWFPVLAFVCVAAVIWPVAGLSADRLSTAEDIGVWFDSDRPWLEAWTRWDGRWYWGIAEAGYWFNPEGQSPAFKLNEYPFDEASRDFVFVRDRQSPVVFFPAYPLLMRTTGPIVGDSLLAGILISLISGLGASVLFYRWCAPRIGPASARIATIVLVLFPFSFFLFGVVFSDALFLLATLGAFLLVERDRPWLAGLGGAVATATRPVGIAVVAGLTLVMLDRRRDPTGRLDLRALRWRDSGVLLSLVGLAAYSAFLWLRFGSPLAFLDAMAEWGMSPGPATWFKTTIADIYAQTSWQPLDFLIPLQVLLSIGALALVPAVWRRFGRGYGTYCLVVILLPLVASKHMVGMGRYILAAFPCFAIAGDWLASRSRFAAAALTFSAAAMIVIVSLFARGYYVS